MPLAFPLPHAIAPPGKNRKTARGITPMQMTLDLLRNRTFNKVHNVHWRVETGFLVQGDGLRLCSSHVREASPNGDMQSLGVI